MDGSTFDRVAKLFADRRLSRRQAFTRGGAGLAAAGLGAAGLARPARAREAPADADGGGTAPARETLFVQSFESGSIAPKADAEGTYTLTLAHGLGQTIYFSDRPDRTVGAVPTAAFLTGFGFPPANPPNAALLVDAGPGDEEIAVLGLYNPRYDTSSNTATYDVRVLKAYERLGLSFQEQSTDLAQLHPSFGAAHLFIDDCATGEIECRGGAGWKVLGNLKPKAFCWSGLGVGCYPCENSDAHDEDAIVAYWGKQCNAAFNDCNGGCLGFVRLDQLACPVIDGRMVCS
jgi:hypothetical protein